MSERIIGNTPQRPSIGRVDGSTRTWRHPAMFFATAVAAILMLVELPEGIWPDSLSHKPRGDQLLLEGLKGGNGKWVEEALASGASVQARDGLDMTPLMWAAELGREELVNRLIAAGADVSATSANGMTALAAAAGTGQTRAMNVLLDAGAPVDQTALFGGTALHFAACNVQAEAVALLIARGADPNRRTRDGQTPLLLALRREQQALPVVETLIRLGADVNLPDNTGRTPIALAATLGNPPLLELLNAARARQ